MTMHTPGKALMHHHPRSLAFATLLTLMASLGFAAAPSTDRDRPTPLTSNEIRGTSGGKGGEYFYTFIAGPGEVALTVDATVGSEHLETAARAELFDMNANLLLSEGVNSARGISAREVGRVKIPNRQPLVMRIILGTNTQRYLVRVEGAVELIQAELAREKPSPSRGKLRIEMNDGFVQEVDLSHVRRLTVEP